jgi:Protein of unknown function (DUF3568)
MKHHLAFAGLLALLAACSHEGSSPSSTSDWGTGLNTVERKYAKTAPQVHDAAVAALKDLGVKVTKDRHDEMGSEIVGERADKSKVMVNVGALDEKSSRATVRVEPGDARMASLVHEKMADELGLGGAKGALLGGNTEERTYDAGLQACADAAERTVKSLGWTAGGKQVHDKWAQVDARTNDSTPVRFRMDRADENVERSKVKFTAGTGKTDDSKTLLSRMREEFDRQIAGHAK